MTPVEIDLMSQLAGEKLRGRTGGSVSWPPASPRFCAAAGARTLFGYFTTSSSCSRRCLF